MGLDQASSYVLGRATFGRTSQRPVRNYWQQARFRGVDSERSDYLSENKRRCCYSISYMRTEEKFLIERRAKNAFLDRKDAFAVFLTGFGSPTALYN